jgi:serine protease AprX
VRRIDRVHTARRAVPEAARRADSPVRMQTPEGPRGEAAPSLDYGMSYGQLDLMNVIPLHDANRFGEGVLVAMLDTGYNRAHESLIHLDVVAERDFINNDPVTKNEPGDPPTQHNHGTYTLSALAGYAPGELIGPAWAASFALAKTERVDVEIQQEEDDFVAGLEWADSLGADIVSSSLAYDDWYTYEDMDGNTAVTTIAADIAASRGIAVVNAAGNAGPLPWPGIMAPADGDSVIAVGAVDYSGVIASFSSRGPTYDGRIKPDVCAQGVSVYAASPADSLSYVWVGGTSLATPLAAGASALCLQMHPYWSPVVLRDELRAKADHAASPNNDYGWGVIDAYQTALYGASGVLDGPAPSGRDIVLQQNVPNPFIPSISPQTTIRFRVGEGTTSAGPTGLRGERHVALAIYDVSGRLVRRLVEGPRSPGQYSAAWDGLDDRGIAVASGVYYYTLSVDGSRAGRKIVLVRR